MGSPVVGAHAVAHAWLYACARVAGVASVFYSYLCALWVWAYGDMIFHDARIWSPLIAFIGDYRIVGVVILVAALLGTAGLALRARPMSYTSAVIGAFWAGWLTSFLAVAHFRGDENMAVLFAGAVMVMFLLRFWLLVITPERDEPRGSGW